MVFIARELCPNCVELIETTREYMVVRDEPVFRVERVVLYCRRCKCELASTITLKFKHNPLIA